MAGQEGRRPNPNPKQAWQAKKIAAKECRVVSSLPRLVYAGEVLLLLLWLYYVYRISTGSGGQPAPAPEHSPDQLGNLSDQTCSWNWKVNPNPNPNPDPNPDPNPSPSPSPSPNPKPNPNPNPNPYPDPIPNPNPSPNPNPNRNRAGLAARGVRVLLGRRRRPGHHPSRPDHGPFIIYLPVPLPLTLPLTLTLSRPDHGAWGVARP